MIDNISRLSFAHAKEVFSDPDKHNGVTFESPFRVVSGKMHNNKGITVYYANAYRSGFDKAYTLFNFTDSGEAFELAALDFVYATGIIEGKGLLSYGAGRTADVLLLKITTLEKYADKAGFKAATRDYKFKEGECKASSGTLSVELSEIKFEQDKLTLMTKTSDPSVETITPYYFEIIAHQEGYFSLYGGCQFWVNLGGASGVDIIPLPAMDSSKDISIDFVPFSKDGKLLYEPLTIDIKLG